MQYSNAVPSTPHSCLTSLRLTRCSHASTLLPLTQVLYGYSPSSIHCPKLSTYRMSIWALNPDRFVIVKTQLYKVLPRSVFNTT